MTWRAISARPAVRHVIDPRHAFEPSCIELIGHPMTWRAMSARPQQQQQQQQQQFFGAPPFGVNSWSGGPAGPGPGSGPGGFPPGVAPPANPGAAAAAVAALMQQLQYQQQQQQQVGQASNSALHVIHHLSNPYTGAKAEAWCLLILVDASSPMSLSPCKPSSLELVDIM